MKVLHTSDWHIGRALYGRKRYAEFESFLNWLAGYIETEKVDVLLVAGDVFDSSTPSNYAQELYYRFLCRVAASSNRHVVVTAGNHDSPSFLNAPRELLKFLNVHVVGCASDPPADELIVLAGKDSRKTLPPPEDEFRDQFAQLCGYCGCFRVFSRRACPEFDLRPSPAETALRGEVSASWRAAYRRYREAPPSLSLY